MHKSIKRKEKNRKRKGRVAKNHVCLHFLVENGARHPEEEVCRTFTRICCTTYNPWRWIGNIDYVSAHGILGTEYRSTESTAIQDAH